MAGDRVNAPSSSSAYLIIHISIVDGSAAGVDVARPAGPFVPPAPGRRRRAFALRRNAASAHLLRG